MPLPPLACSSACSLFLIDCPLREKRRAVSRVRYMYGYEHAGRAGRPVNWCMRPQGQTVVSWSRNPSAEAGPGRAYRFWVIAYLKGSLEPIICHNVHSQWLLKALPRHLLLNCLQRAHNNYAIAAGTNNRTKLLLFFSFHWCCCFAEWRSESQEKRKQNVKVWKRLSIQKIIIQTDIESGSVSMILNGWLGYPADSVQFGWVL